MTGARSARRQITLRRRLDSPTVVLPFLLFSASFLSVWRLQRLHAQPRWRVAPTWWALKSGYSVNLLVHSSSTFVADILRGPT